MPRTTGRPRLDRPSQSGNKVMIGVRVTPQFRDALYDVVDTHGGTVSDFVRESVFDALMQHAVAVAKSTPNPTTDPVNAMKRKEDGLG